MQIVIKIIVRFLRRWDLSSEGNTQVMKEETLKWWKLLLENQQVNLLIKKYTWKH